MPKYSDKDVCKIGDFQVSVVSCKSVATHIPTCMWELSSEIVYDILTHEALDLAEV